MTPDQVKAEPRLERFLARVEEIMHPQQGIPVGANQKAMICEAYDILITGLEREHAESRTESLIDFMNEAERLEEARAAQAQYEQEHDL